MQALDTQNTQIMLTEGLEIAGEVSVLEAFTNGDGLNPIINQARELVEGFEHDLSTKAGRQRTASLARKVASLKTKLDGMGKELVSDWKEKAKVVDRSRKEMRDQLDAIKAEARKPLDQWEEEEHARLQAINAELSNLRDLSNTVDENGEPLTLDALQKNLATLEEITPTENIIGPDFAAWNTYREAGLSALPAVISREKKRIQEQSELERLRKEAAEREEAERVEAIKREAAKQAIADAEKQAEEKAKEQERERVQAEVRAEEAERKQAEAEKAAELEKQKSEERARLAAEAAKQAEIDRQKQAEKEAREKAEKLEADRAHVGRVLAEIKAAIAPYVTNEDAARALVLAIRKGEIPRVSIDYQEAGQ